MLSRKFHGQSAKDEYRGIEVKDGGQLHRMPIADLAQRPRVHVRARLTRIKQSRQYDEEHHVAGKSAEHKGSHAV